MFKYYKYNEKTGNTLNQFLNRSMLLASIFLFHYSEINNSVSIQYIAVALLTPILFMSDQDAFFAMLLLMPSATSIYLGNISITSLIPVYIIIRKLFLGKIQVTKLMFLIFSLFIIHSLLFFLNGSTEPVNIAIKTICMLLFTTYVFKENNEQLHLFFCESVNWIAFGVAGASFSAIFLSGSVVYSKRFSISEDSGVNSLAIYCSFVIVCLIIELIMGKINNKASFLFATITCVFIGILTQSRTFLLLSGIAAVWFIFTIAKHKKKFRNVIIILIIALIIFINLSYSTFPNTGFSEAFNSALNRILSPNHDDISNGRYEIWDLYYTALKNNPFVLFFGTGNFTNLGLKMAAHNMWIEIIVSYGILGLIYLSYLFVVMLTSVFKKQNANYKYDLNGFIPIVLLFLALFYSHSPLGTTNVVILMLGALPIFIMRKLKENKRRMFL